MPKFRHLQCSGFFSSEKINISLLTVKVPQELVESVEGTSTKKSEVQRHQGLHLFNVVSARSSLFHLHLQRPVRHKLDCELQFDINSTVEGAALAAKFRALESTWPINQCNLYDSDFFGPSVTFFRRVDYFSRSLQMRPCSMPADVHASLDGVVFDRKDDIVTLRHEFSAPLPTFHGVEVQFFYTIYDHMVAANFSKGAVVAKGDVLGQVVSLAMPPLRFELRVGGPYSLEYQAKHTTAYNVGFDPAVNWNWLLHIVDEPIPPPSLKLLTAVTGVVAGRVEFSIDGKAGWLNKVTYESLDRNYSLLAIAELDLNFRTSRDIPTSISSANQPCTWTQCLLGNSARMQPQRQLSTVRRLCFQPLCTLEAPTSAST
eukprot:g76975.t1